MSAKTIGVSAMIAALSLAAATTSEAGGRFSVRSLKGIYGFSGSGTLAGGTIPAGVVGLNSYDRAGGCDVSARLNAGGVVHSLSTAECSYTVNSDGTGQLRVTFDHPIFAGPFISDFVIVDEAKELPFSLSDPSGGTVATGVAKKQSSEGRD